VNSINNPSQRGSHTIKQNKQTIRVAGKIWRKLLLDCENGFEGRSAKNTARANS
jgi:hypothetical protein